MSNLLDGVRVVDFTQVISGPYATYMLARQGADVIKLEQPGTGDQSRSMMSPSGEYGARGQSPMFLAFNSGKRSLALDLKHPDAKEIISKLVANADVVVENFKAGVLNRLGFGYEWAREVKPDIVYCSISGFGQVGPRAGAAAYDPVIQATSGMMTLTGHEGVTGPTKVGFWVCDVATGMTGAFAISAALARRGQTGEGAYIDLSMLDVAASFISPMVTNFLNFGVEPRLMGNGSPAGSNVSSVYETKQGFIQVAAATQGQFMAQTKAMGLESLLEDARFNTREGRIANADALRVILLGRFKDEDAKTWETRLSSAGVPAGAVLTVPDMTADSQIAERGVIQSGPAPAGLPGEFSTVGAPFIVNASRENSLPSTPSLGQHSREILAEAGYSEDRIEALFANRAVS